MKAIKVTTQNAQPARLPFQHPLLQTSDVLLTHVPPTPLDTFIVCLLSAGKNLCPVVSQILILPMYIFLLSSQQCNLLLTWYFHSSQWITWQSSSPTARNNQTEAQLITSAPPRSCRLFPFYIVAALTIFIALAWIRIEYSNSCFRAVNRKFINGFCGNTCLTSCQA